MMEMLVENNAIVDVEPLQSSLHDQSIRPSEVNAEANREYFYEELAFEKRLDLARDLIQESGLSVKDKLMLENLISPNHGTVSSDQRKLISAIIRLQDRAENEHLAQASTTIPREEIINSVLESVARGSIELGQGNVASCTATSTGKIYIRHNGVGAYAELMTDLLLDGYHNFDNDPNRQIKLNESGVRKERDHGLFEGASIAESIFRASVMELSCRGLEGSDARMNFRYDDATGDTYVFDDQGQQVGSFAGMHRDGWIYTMEQMMGSGVEFMSSTQDQDGLYSPDVILKDLIKSSNGAGIELAYAENGPHNRHFCVFSHVDNGRVYFDNPHKNLTEKNFSKKSDSHRLEANGLESMSIDDFKERLLSASIVREGSAIGSFAQSNQAQQVWRSTVAISNWYLENRHAHIDVQSSIAKLHGMATENDKQKGSGKINVDSVNEDIFYSFQREEDMSSSVLQGKQSVEEKLRANLLKEMHAKRHRELLEEKFNFNPLSLRSDNSQLATNSENSMFSLSA